MAFFHTRLLIAFDARSVSGTTVRRGVGGLRTSEWIRVPLQPGALRPSPTEDNVVEPDVVSGAVASLCQKLGGGERAVLVMPEGTARISILEPPRGVDVREYARFRMTQALPYAPTEAVVDCLPVARGLYLCGAVRRAVAEGYEAVAESAKLHAERLDAAPFVAMSGLRRRAAAGGAGVALLLGDAAVSFAAFSGGRLAVFRTRLRQPGADEAGWLQDELTRTVAMAGDARIGPVAVVGAGAGATARSLRSLGCEADPVVGGASGDDPTEAAELDWLGAALA
jgi:hypothetical protein